jgi:hypothetical protein
MSSWRVRPTYISWARSLERESLRRIAAADRRAGRDARLRRQCASRRRPQIVSASSWRPTTREQLQRLVAEQLNSCTDAQRQFFEKHRVEPYSVSIRRLGKTEKVFVVAQFGDLLLYYEDIEDGFELDRLDASGVIPKQGCNQFELRHVLHQLTATGHPEYERRTQTKAEWRQQLIEVDINDEVGGWIDDFYTNFYVAEEDRKCLERFLQSSNVNNRREALLALILTGPTGPKYTGYALDALIVHLLGIVEDEDAQFTGVSLLAELRNRGDEEAQSILESLRKNAKWRRLFCE